MEYVVFFFFLNNELRLKKKKKSNYTKVDKTKKWVLSKESCRNLRIYIYIEGRREAPKMVRWFFSIYNEWICFNRK